MKTMVSKMVIYIFVVALCLFCACGTKTEKDIYQSSRKNVVDVKEFVHEIAIDENVVAFSNSTNINVMKDYLIISDYKSISDVIYFFNKNDFSFVASTGRFGQGPGEIENLGTVNKDQEHGKLYVSDNSKLKLYSFDVDSVVANSSDYQPTVKKELDMRTFPSSFVYLSDTFCIAKAIRPTSPSTFESYLGVWNMESGQMRDFSNETPVVENKKISFAYSEKAGKVAEAHSRSDLVSVYDLKGNLIHNIYGPDWGEKKRFHYFSDGFFFNNLLFLLYAGSKDSVYDKLMVFSSDGEYKATLNLGYTANRLAFDEPAGRVYFSCNDVIQFAYLDLADIAALK